MIIQTSETIVIPEETIVTIGKFDGDHIGHQSVFSCMRALKMATGRKLAVFNVLGKTKDPLYDDDRRRAVLEAEGVDYLVECHFGDPVTGMEAGAFVEEILLRQMHARAVVVGTDCRFGRNRTGNADTLRMYISKGLDRVVILDKLTDENGREISTTYIKELLKEGKEEKANEFLGRKK